MDGLLASLQFRRPAGVQPRRHAGQPLERGRLWRGPDLCARIPSSLELHRFTGTASVGRRHHARRIAHRRRRFDAADAGVPSVRAVAATHYCARIPGSGSRRLAHLHRAANGGARRRPATGHRRIPAGRFRCTARTQGLAAMATGRHCVSGRCRGRPVNSERSCAGANRGHLRHLRGSAGGCSVDCQPTRVAGAA